MRNPATRVLQPRRTRLLNRRRTPPGAPPGTLVPDPGAAASEVHLIAYGPERIVDEAVSDIARIRTLAEGQAVTWVNVNGLGDPALIQRLADEFSLHRLAIEDVINTHQRPKVEDYGHHTFLVTRMFRMNEKIESEQVSVFLGQSFVLTFQERPGDCFDPVRKRLRERKGRLRDAGADYLFYALTDAIIDSYFPILEAYGERVEQLEDAVLEKPSERFIKPIHEVKRDLLMLRRTVWPQREAINALLRDLPSQISDTTRPYLRDCYDHTVQILDNVETLREIATDLVDVHLSSMSSRLNEVIKVLTLIATIFIPLSFIASIYGMNFDPTASPYNMPELEWVYGYPFALAVMAAVGLGLVYYFWRKGWIGSDGRK